jgi:hypothetical protein
MISAQSTVNYGNFFPLNGDTLQNVAPGGSVYLSPDSGKTWTRKIPQPTGGYIFQVAELDDGRTIYIPRAGGANDVCQQYINDVRSGAVDSAKGPFFPINCCSIESRMIKLQSGRLLHLAPAAAFGQYAIGESVDSARRWFVRRFLPVDAGEGMIIQSRDGIIHALFERNRFSLGSHSVFSFSEEWLREGSITPFPQWVVAGHESRVDTLRREPGYLPPLGAGIEAGAPSLNAKAGLRMFASPNPSNPSTLIRYSLPTGAAGSLCLFNVRGERILKVELTGNRGEFRWEGGRLPSGVYVARLMAGSAVIEKRITLVK